MMNDIKSTVGFQGVSGSFSEQALFEYFKNDVVTKAVKEFEDIFVELENNAIDYGIIPIENSSTGAISEVYDLLNKYSVYIIGEVCLKVSHHLMGVKGSRLEDIVEVYSHSQAFGQCREFLKSHPEWKLIPYHNTARSAELVMNRKCKSMAAIGSRRAAEIYGLDIIAGDINSNSTNTTRFVVISRVLNTDSFCDKISVVLSTVHKAGALYNVLRYFAENNINLLKIESRPIVDRPWEYLFYIDFEGNINDSIIKRAIQSIKDNSCYFKLIGNYKAYIGRPL